MDSRPPAPIHDLSSDEALGQLQVHREGDSGLCVGPHRRPTAHPCLIRVTAQNALDRNSAPLGRAS